MAHIKLVSDIMGGGDLTLYDSYTGVNKLTLNPPGYTLFNGVSYYNNIVYPIQQPDCISILIPVNSNHCGYNLRSKDKINFSNYKTIELETLSPYSNVDQRFLGVMLTSIDSGELNPSNSIEVMWQSVQYGTKQTILLDVSNIEGQLYFIWGTAGGNRGGNIYKIKLIHK